MNGLGMSLINSHKNKCGNTNLRVLEWFLYFLLMYLLRKREISSWEKCFIKFVSLQDYYGNLDTSHIYTFMAWLYRCACRVALMYFRSILLLWCTICGSQMTPRMGYKSITGFTKPILSLVIRLQKHISLS